MNPVPLAIVGLRNIGQGHARNAAPLPGATLVAGCDTDPERLADAAKTFGFTETYSNFNAFLDQTSAEAVVLAVPNHLHSEMTIACLAAGKHVLVEKPMARNADEAEAMVGARDVAGKVLAIGMNQRYAPQHRALREAVRSGVLGELYMAKAWWNRRRPHDGLWGRGDWFMSWEASGGGPLIDIGVHKLDLALWLMDFPKILSVDATCSYGIGKAEGRKRGKNYEVEDLAVAHIRLDNGVTLLLESSYFHNSFALDVNRVDLFGTVGSFDEGALFEVVDGDLRELELPDPPDGPGSPVAHFVNVIRGEEELTLTPEQGVATTRALDAMYQSAREGHAIDL